jgi:Phosphotransferase enzyme family
MIRGYPNPPSVLQGEAVRLHIASDTPLHFQIWFYRQGQTLVLKARTEAMVADALPLGAPDLDWNWPIYEYPIPRDWESGAYIARFVPVEQEDIRALADPGHPEAAALFVVKNRVASAKILYKLPLFTYHAYNELGNPCGSLYTGGYNKLTLHRPGGGVGGRPWDRYFPDDYDPSSPRQTFWHWDAPFIRWLERRCLAVDYCTDLDIHKNFWNFLETYRLLLSVGHDEYWSEQMRRNVEAFVENGGNVAFFSGNTCWWRVHLVEGNAAFVCDKTKLAGDGQKREQWFNVDPENRLTGVSSRNGGGQWWGKREPIGYRVQHAEHWIFEGTGLRDGDTFGADHALIGYECDGASISDRPDEQGFAVPRHDDGTPENFMILGTGRLGPEWAQDPEGFAGGRTATMGIYANNGVVFTAATTDWPRVLGNGDPHVEKITENILCRLGSGETEHPAMQAWSQLYSKRSKRNFIELLSEGRKSCVYRLDGVGPGGTAVIAKRSMAREAHVEQTIYEEVLPDLPISSLTFYGVVDEPGTEFRWLFLEDAENADFTYFSEQHRKLAARWLGLMHVGAERVFAVSRLPDRGPQHYLNHLHSSRRIIEGNLGDPALHSQDLEVLDSILLQGRLLESRWMRVVELCRRYPRTLVHCDFAHKNLRVRSNPSGINLVAFDWEMAGYGIPAPDVAEWSGRGVPRRITGSLPDSELVDYWEVVRESWSYLDLPAMKELAELGAVFRLLLAISWESESIGRGWWPIEELRGYQADLAIALENLGFAR